MSSHGERSRRSYSVHSSQGHPFSTSIRRASSNGPRLSRRTSRHPNWRLSAFSKEANYLKANGILVFRCRTDPRVFYHLPERYSCRPTPQTASRRAPGPHVSGCTPSYGTTWPCAYGRPLFKALYLYLTSDKRKQIPFQSVIQCGLILTRLPAELDIRQCTVSSVGPALRTTIAMSCGLRRLTVIERSLHLTAILTSIQDDSDVCTFQ